jgi:hypothetical protein
MIETVLACEAQTSADDARGEFHVSKHARQLNRRDDTLKIARDRFREGRRG